MLQIKLIKGESVDDLANKVNDFLTSVETVTDIKVTDTSLMAVIQYEIGEQWKKEICTDCKYWDCGQSSDALMGLCQRCGGRRRFNSLACKEWEDNRR